MTARVLDASRPRRTAASRPTVRVLVATTCPHRRHALASVLRKLGYVVYTARDGMSAAFRLAGVLLEADPHNAPDLIICDIRLPGVMGTTILSGLRDNGWTKPVFMLCEFNDSVARRRALTAGATYVFDKPVDIGKLCRAALDSVPIPSDKPRRRRRTTTRTRAIVGETCDEGRVGPLAETPVDRLRRRGAL